MKNVLALLALTACLASGQRRVAVLTIDTQSTPSVREQISNAFRNPGTPPGDLLAEYLGSGLSGKEGIVLVDREFLNRTLQEQNLGMSDRFDEEKALKLGKLLQADSIVIGKVTNFSVRSEDGGVGFGGVKLGRSKMTSTISITAKLVNVETGLSVMASATGEQQSAGKIGVNIKGNHIDKGQKEEFSSIAQIAMERAANQLASQLVERSRTIPVARRPSPGVTELQFPVEPLPAGPKTAAHTLMVAKVNGSTLYLNGGQAHGLKAGDRLTVSRPGEDILDPVTNRILGQEPRYIEIVTISSVMEQMSVAASNGISKAQVRDLLTPAPPEKRVLPPRVAAKPGALAAQR